MLSDIVIIRNLFYYRAVLVMLWAKLFAPNAISFWRKCVSVKCHDQDLHLSFWKNSESVPNASLKESKKWKIGRFHSWNLTLISMISSLFFLRNFIVQKLIFTFYLRIYDMFSVQSVCDSRFQSFQNSLANSRFMLYLAHSSIHLSLITSQKSIFML